MKKPMTIIGAIMFTTLMLSSCGSEITVCECLKDDGSHKEECDELANSMSSSERSEAIANCK